MCLPYAARDQLRPPVDVLVDVRLLVGVAWNQRLDVEKKVRPSSDMNRPVSLADTLVVGTAPRGLQDEHSIAPVVGSKPYISWNPEFSKSVSFAPVTKAAWSPFGDTWILVSGKLPSALRVATNLICPPL